MRRFFGGILALALLLPAVLADEPSGGARHSWALDCDAAAEYSRSARGIAVIIVLHGQIVCEDYAPGIDAAQAWELASGAKSFTSIIAAAAVQDGLITLDERVADTITEWQGDPRRSQITVRQLLAQTSGLATRGDTGRLPGYRASIRTRARHVPGTAFMYGPRHFQAFGEFMRRKLDAAGLDATPAHYLVRRVLDPLGIELDSWAAIDGMPVMSEGVEITPVNWARFGHFVLNDGVVNGINLVDREAMTAMFEAGRANRAYGLSWWLANPSRAPSPAVRPNGQSSGMIEAEREFPPLRLAAGAGGQRLWIIPELDLVIVRMTRGVTADPASRQSRWSDRAFLNRLLTPRQAGVQPGQP